MLENKESFLLILLAKKALRNNDEYVLDGHSVRARRPHILPVDI